ncbi:hypothetical protein QLL95_gp0679 [Cotonvirus japonicus]|uniref:Uncharacterized protein n=1 Tax=Cotonvirus japonicus TaxID=2811091 RepID=A0ABM7NTE8_9VIRU|nr:hypothetical protein QLL95_gp0679 [Cotonvirus japonicus]BCS83444.1 hypothetical protein [Cotonvirus japonicus]
MGVSRERISYCNDCANNKGSGWKIVQEDSVHTKHKKCHCVPEVQRHHNNCSQIDDPCNRNRNLQLTYVSVINPTTVLPIPNSDINGVFAQQAVNAVTNVLNLTGWSDTTADILDSFNNATGVYTAPSSGDYLFDLDLAVRTSTSLNVDPELTDVPFVELVDVATGDRLIGGFVNFPVTSTNITIPPIASGELPIEINITTLLAIGQANLNTIVSLTAGQQVVFRVSSNGLTYTPSGLIPPVSASISFAPGSFLTIQKLRNTPTITYTL